MKINLYYLLISLAALLVLSCTSTAVQNTVPEEIFIVLPVEIQKPDVPENIMSQVKASAGDSTGFLLQNNPQADRIFVFALSNYYIEEAGFEGVNHDVAFAQMCLETGFLKYGGDVKPEQFNFCGLGATGGVPGLSFPDPRTGVRAQIQHLKAYASEEPLKGENVDPRFRYVRRGSSPTIEGLAGTWAADRQYAVKINSMLARLYDFSFNA